MIRQKKKGFGEIKKSKSLKYKVKKMSKLKLRISLVRVCMRVCVCVYVCVCLCTCVDYVGIELCVVVYVIVSVCVYVDTCAAWQICGCLMNICIVMCSKICRKSRDCCGFGQPDDCRIKTA